MKNLKEKKIIYILLIGLISRLFFLFFLAKSIFNRTSIFTDSDTFDWAYSIETLIKHGTYSVELSNQYGYFVRMPGYSFFIGIFYLITGCNWDLAFPVIGIVQLLLDVFSIFLIYKIVLKVFSVDKIALIAALLYATYPFIIVWNPVVYSESISVFLLWVGLYYLVYNEKKRNIYFSGIFIGLALLCRPQIALIVPIIVVYLFFHNKFKLKFQKIIYFLLMVLLIYGVWPLRNYINYGKIIYTQDLRGIGCWDNDVLSFMQYIYSVKTDWEPQFGQIIHNEKVVFPRNAYDSKDDSLKLEEAVMLAKNCSSGFSQWKGYWKKPFLEPNCNERVIELFTELRNNQMKNHPVNYYFIVPIHNLSKALFKMNLVKNNSHYNYIKKFLFVYRTLLIILGLFGGVIMLSDKKREQKLFSIIVLGFFGLLYLYLCAGTSVQLRNIEMRYFLQADVLLLIPASFVINKIIQIKK